VVKATHRQLFTPGKESLSVVQEGVWTAGPFLTGDENLALIGIRSLDHTARTESLYRLYYPGPLYSNNKGKVMPLQPGQSLSVPGG
jgi:hypothetical protein